MFWNKLNVFHWHLTDDQSFPYESSAFPNLSAKGAYTPDLVYTQDDVRQVIEYSRNRGIRVIPEFDAPGHTYSFGKAMPDILTPCYGDGETPGTPNYPLHAERETMNPMLDSTYAFLRTFFEEVVSTFPDTFVHLGMDEVNYNCWKSSPEIAAFMQDNGMTEYAEVEQYFVERHSETIAELGARQIVWQDPLEKGVEFPDGTVVQIWKWEWEVQGWTPWQDYMSMSTALGYQSLLSSCWYLNMISYGEQWISYYECDPHDFEGTQEQKGLVLGGEGALWMEYIDPTNIHPLLWPRASAIAERLWSSADVRDIPAARYRLDEQRCRLLGRGIPAAPVFNGYCPKITVGGLNSPMTNSTIINEDFHKRA
uniref:beta-N-acetylhexosaminidase n=1 Tax=Dolerocypris sinensis TaxID=114095 RepID=A0A6G5W6I3_9CRUS|nr:chitobiase [Dolerocypris sinensis]